MADKVADGEEGNIDRIKATDILKKIAEGQIISIVDEKGIPFFGNLRRRLSKEKLKRYLKKRDDYREKDGKLRVWEGASLQHIHKMMGRKKTIEDRSAVARIAYGKRWCSSWINEEICKACEEAPRSIRHTLMQCGNERMREGRKIWTEEVERKIGKIRDVDLKGAVSELWSRMKTGSGGEYAMYGCFQLRMMDGLYKGNMPIRDGEDRIVTNILRSIGEGARTLTNLYMDARLGEDLRKELRQTNMFGFYKSL